ncbi:hypothetical protein [Burkholderia pseudomallei]|uniref:hypothetical protein n=1 Tax=Burkholderia pseudomallei TaxID=28450 RepID=UPI0011076C52|nr:hypothetical protein [Burkholderia pseudomallei]MBO2974545.1 hypothetical protein [Burkholderia pseudomallei]MBO7755619.1 hypothetical protein [Burkholderia pseudomallei]MBO7820533.1 hypothetical protein [Burkholderia pseudomallei]MBO7856396.1 hypothetical protein [Burkholderia pseudomallei]MBO7886428.1 hypothetical protein [Burkholderia pseudomallei]
MDDMKLSERLARVKAAMEAWGWPGFEPWVESARAKDPEAVRDLLAAFVIQLRELSFPSSPISITLAHFISDALAAYLGGDEQTLDKAFGVAKGRGAPATATADHVELARKMVQITRNIPPREPAWVANSVMPSTAAWKAIFQAAQDEGWPVTDDSELRKIYKKFAATALGESIARRLDDADHRRLKLRQLRLRRKQRPQARHLRELQKPIGRGGNSS